MFGVLLVVVGVVVIGVAVVASNRKRDSPVGQVRCTGKVGTGQPVAGEIPAPPPVDSGTHFTKGRTPLCGFGEVVVTVVDRSGARHQWCLLAAVTEAQRERGLMEVRSPSLGGYDGMVFTFDTDQAGGFYMRDTPMPLSIAYVGAGGRVVKTDDMAPCRDSADCPTYPSGGAFRTAIEVPQGRLGRLGIAEGSQVTVERLSMACPARAA